MQTHEQEPQERINQFRISSLILPFYVPSVLSFMGVGMVVPLLALIARSMGASLAGAGFVVGLFGLGHVLFNIPAGLLITRFGKRRTILGATALEAILAVILGFVHSVEMLAIFIFLLGCIHTVFYVTRLSFFRALVPVTHRGRSLALIGGSNRFGQFIGPIVGGFVVEHVGYQYAFWGFALCMAITLAILYRWIPRDDDGVQNDRPAAAIPARGGLSRTMDILRSHAGTFATAGVSIVVLQLLRTARQVLIPLVGESAGLSVSQIGLVFGIMVFLELLLFYPAGIIMDRFGRKATAVPCLTILALAFLALPAVTGFFSMLLVALAAGVGNGLGSGINMTLSTDFAPERNPGEFIGVWRFIADVGTAGGPFLVGAITGIMSLAGAAAVVTVVGITGAAVMGILVPETLKRPGEPARQSAS